MAAVKELFRASGVSEAADVFMDAASTHASFGGLAHKDEAKAKALLAAAEHVNTHFRGLYCAKTECLRSTICNPQFGLRPNNVCFGCHLIRSDESFNRRLRLKVNTLSQPKQAVALKRRKDTLSSIEQRELSKRQHGEVRAQKKVCLRAEVARQRWKDKFQSAVTAAAEVVADWRAKAATKLSALLGDARAKEAELAELQQELVDSRQQLAAEREQAASQLVAERARAAQQLATASIEEEARLGIMRRAAQSSREGHMKRLVAEHERQLKQLERDLMHEFNAQLERVGEQHAKELNSFPTYIQNLIRAEKLGHAAEHPVRWGLPRPLPILLLAQQPASRLTCTQACIDILKGIATCLSKNSTGARRELNETEKQLYAILLNSQSPWAVKFVSHNLLGPHVRTIQKLRAQRSPEIALEVGIAAVSEVLVPLLTEHDLLDVPGGCCEDGTSANRKLDWELMDEPAACENEVNAETLADDESRRAIIARDDARMVQQGGDTAATTAALQHIEEDRARDEALDRLGEMPTAMWRRGLKIWGFDGGPVVVRSQAELLALFENRKRNIARYVYVYTWVVTAKHAPWFPFIMLATDNKFTGTWCWLMWRKLHDAFARVRLKQTWHGSDGDSRMRLCDYVMNAYVNRDRNLNWCTGSAFRLDHPLMLLHVPRTKEGFALLAGQDLVHILWRWKRQMLDPKKTLHLHHHIVSRAHLKDVPWLTGPMLDYKNKQDWPGVQAIFSQRTCDFLQGKIQNGETYRCATWVYCVMGCKLLSAWFAEANEASNGWTPSQSVQNAACVLAHLVIWRSAIVKNKQHKLANDCMTRETLLDSYTSCATCIYRFPLYRKEHPEHKPYGPNFCQSRFSEYGFQKCRMEEATNSPSLSVKGFFVAFKHTLFQICMEAKSKLRLPDSRRGVPHSIGRVEPDPPSPAYRRATEDAQVLRDFLAGIQLCSTIWRQVLSFDVSTELPGFFEEPWKHFDLPADLANLRLDDASGGGKEDDEDNDEPLNSQDADDAAELMGRLIAQHSQQLIGDGESFAPDKADLQLQRYVGPIFREFNSHLSEEAYKRKHRFRTSALVEGAQDATRALLCEDSDIIAVFEHSDGTLYWIPGRIEQLGITAADIDESRICDADLQRLEKRHETKASVDDARAVFLVRWYVEVDKNGVNLDPSVDGYNGRKCFGYRLTMANNGEPFRWVSNFQVLMPVEMVSHPHEQCRMFRVHRNDRQPIADRFAEVRGSSSQPGVVAVGRGARDTAAGASNAPTVSASGAAASNSQSQAAAAIARAARSERAAARTTAREQALAAPVCASAGSGGKHVRR